MQKWAAFLLVTAVTVASHAADPAPQIKPGVRSPITFKDSVPLASAEQLKLRLHAKEEPAPYDIKNEQFEILLPKSYKNSETYGLFIWISPGGKPALPPEWDKVLGEKKLIFIGAQNSGNNREVFDRMRLAVDANHNVRQLYDIDAKRVYVSGHSGGSRVASMLGVAYADMFSGAACFMGANYFRNLTGDDGTVYEMRYLPHPEIAMGAIKDGRFALVTGEKDFNLLNTQAVYKQGFLEEKFQGVKLFNIPGQPHGLPSAEWLEKVVEFLDKRK
jgi:predicted esterase